MILLAGKYCLVWWCVNRRLYPKDVRGYEILPVYFVFIPLPGLRVLFPLLCCSGLSHWLHWNNKSCFQSHVKLSVLIDLSALIASPVERLGGKFLDWDVTIPVGIRGLWFPFFLLRAQQMSACWHLEGMSSFPLSLLGSVLLTKHNVLKLSIWSTAVPCTWSTWVVI